MGKMVKAIPWARLAQSPVSAANCESTGRLEGNLSRKCVDDVKLFDSILLPGTTKAEPNDVSTTASGTVVPTSKSGNGEIAKEILLLSEKLSTIADRLRKGDTMQSQADQRSQSSDRDKPNSGFEPSVKSKRGWCSAQSKSDAVQREASSATNTKSFSESINVLLSKNTAAPKEIADALEVVTDELASMLEKPLESASPALVKKASTLVEVVEKFEERSQHIEATKVAQSSGSKVDASTSSGSPSDASTPTTPSRTSATSPSSGSKADSKYSKWNKMEQFTDMSLVAFKVPNDRSEGDVAYVQCFVENDAKPVFSSEVVLREGSWQGSFPLECIPGGTQVTFEIRHQTASGEVQVSRSQFLITKDTELTRATSFVHSPDIDEVKFCIEVKTTPSIGTRTSKSAPGRSQNSLDSQAGTRESRTTCGEHRLDCGVSETNDTVKNICQELTRASRTTTRGERKLDSAASEKNDTVNKIYQELDTLLKNDTQPPEEWRKTLNETVDALSDLSQRDPNMFSVASSLASNARKVAEQRVQEAKSEAKTDRNMTKSACSQHTSIVDEQSALENADRKEASPQESLQREVSIDDERILDTAQSLTGFKSGARPYLTRTQPLQNETLEERLNELGDLMKELQGIIRTNTFAAESSLHDGSNVEKAVEKVVPLGDPAMEIACENLLQKVQLFLDTETTLMNTPSGQQKVQLLGTAMATDLPVVNSAALPRKLSKIVADVRGQVRDTRTFVSEIRIPRKDEITIALEALEQAANAICVALQSVEKAQQMIQVARNKRNA